MKHPSIPRATYRLQLHREFTFPQAAAICDYLRDLGISHVYSSPFFQAAPGSTHGYDISDQNKLNPEIGTTEEFESWSRAMKAADLSLLVDFVPNHMGIADAGNAWWMDVLEHGPSSLYASYFDIDWQPLKRELKDKVLLPILGDQYGRVLENGELKLSYSDGVFQLSYYETKLPLEPCSLRPILLRAATLVRDKMAADELLEFESVITGIEHLPLPTSRERDQIVERSREQAVLKRRLNGLTSRSPALQGAIEQALQELQTPDDRTAFDALDALLLAQNYRLSYWRVAGEEINYRRFFDINSLAAIRMELPEVFEAAHKLIFDLIEQGAVHGLRIDHVDGLYYPREYFQKLQERYGRIFELPATQTGLYLVVEKILELGEHLRADWPVHGTTGYEFANQVLAILVDPAARDQFTQLYERFTGNQERFADLVYEAKLLVMRLAMASEINVLGNLLNRLSETNRWYRDFTLNSLTSAVREVIACFPVYRTYITPDGSASEIGQAVIDRALAGARRRNPAIERSVFNFLRDVLLPREGELHPVDEATRREFVMKFQQCSGPITAKGVEDTTFYKYNRLVALNEVGGDPGHFGGTAEQFHEQNATRGTEFPHTLLATSTHDTKRSEDVRARIAALSELPEEWGRTARDWQTLNRSLLRPVDGETAPSANEEYLLYQVLIGSWPLELMDLLPLPEDAEDAEEATRKYVERLQNYMLKALHEAKVNSSWIDPNQAWDKAVQEFVADLLDRSKREEFFATFLPLARKVAQLGAINSLTQTLLKMTVPGVPDFYQGNEIWDFSLVDPDNRRPVDYDLRRRLLSELGAEPDAAELLAHWADGRIKLHVVRTLLQFRREQPELFMEGAYESVEPTGEFAGSVLAFERVRGADSVLVVVPRLTARVGFPPVGEVWRDTALPIGGSWRDLFTRERVSGEKLAVSDVLRQFPVAVLVPA